MSERPPSTSLTHAPSRTHARCRPAQLSSRFPRFAPRALVQLVALPDEGLLVSLHGGGGVAAHSLPPPPAAKPGTLPAAPRAPPLPSASAGCAALRRCPPAHLAHWDGGRGVLVLCCRACVLLFRYDDAASDFAPSAARVDVAEPVRCVAWANDGLLLGLDEARLPPQQMNQ